MISFSQRSKVRALRYYIFVTLVIPFITSTLLAQEITTTSISTTLQGRTDFSGNYEAEIYEVADLVNPLLSETILFGSDGIWTINGLPPGDYVFWLKHPQFLSHAIVTTIVDGENSVQLGELRNGDANDDNGVSILDFGILINNFNTSSQNQNWDERPDFNADEVINILDFSLFVSNFNLAGTGPGGATTGTRLINRPPTRNIVDFDLIVRQSAENPDFHEVEVVVHPNSQLIDGAQFKLNYDPNALRVIDHSGGFELPVTLAIPYTDPVDGSFTYSAGAMDHFPKEDFTLMTIMVEGDIQTLHFDESDELNNAVTFQGKNLIRTLNSPVLVDPAFSIYPNPVSGEAYTTFTPLRDGALELKIMSLTGQTMQMVYQGAVRHDQSYHWPFQLDSAYPSGIYLMVATQGDEQWTRQLVYRR